MFLAGVCLAVPFRLAKYAESMEALDTIRLNAPLGEIRVPGVETCFVEGVIDGFPVRASVVGGKLDLTPGQVAAIGADLNETVTVEITRIGDEPEVRVPSDFVAALESAPAAAALWPQVTPMARREWVRWFISGKQEETRRKRMEVGLDKLAKGMRRPCCFPGLNWVIKDKVSAEETWAPLPKLV